MTNIEYLIILLEYTKNIMGKKILPLLSRSGAGDKYTKRIPAKRTSSTKSDTCYLII